MKIHKNAAFRLFAALAVCCMAFCACNTDIPIIDGGGSDSENDQKTCDDEGKERCFAPSESNQLATLKTCKDGHWTLTETCASPRCSSDLSACDPCADGETVCANGKDNTGVIYKCEDNHLITKSVCTTSCKTDGTCGECVNGALSSCGGGWLTTCVNGVKFTEQCPDNGICINDTACGCAPNAQKCTKEENSEQGKIKTCSSSGVWGAESICRTSDKIAASCSSDESCGECLNGTTKCEYSSDQLRNVIYECQSGLWVKSKLCTALVACNSAKTECAI